MYCFESLEYGECLYQILLDISNISFSLVVCWKDSLMPWTYVLRRQICSTSLNQLHCRFVEEQQYDFILSFYIENYLSLYKFSCFHLQTPQQTDAYSCGWRVLITAKYMLDSYFGERQPKFVSQKIFSLQIF